MRKGRGTARTLSPASDWGRLLACPRSVRRSAQRVRSRALCPAAAGDAVDERPVHWIPNGRRCSRRHEGSRARRMTMLCARTRWCSPVKSRPIWFMTPKDRRQPRPTNSSPEPRRPLSQILSESGTTALHQHIQDRSTRILNRRRASFSMLTLSSPCRANVSDGCRACPPVARDYGPCNVLPWPALADRNAPRRNSWFTALAVQCRARDRRRGGGDLTTRSSGTSFWAMRSGHQLGGCHHGRRARCAAPCASFRSGVRRVSPTAPVQRTRRDPLPICHRRHGVNRVIDYREADGSCSFPSKTSISVGRRTPQRSRSQMIQQMAYCCTRRRGSMRHWIDSVAR